ncbi:glutaminyl-peptide cyclotransferase [Microbacterium sp.]|uniref:glutaminyl-peptide cyclotransferase n=1 Tax=Microbacterium sp. TaxID=51671 RepID=UPI002606762F|nr:glutaminyl-peptide cyclotransferase [Microbacterium sp.]MCV0334725.1 glutaminyl-peptide cyclotransferase [Microbacterium sp.]MCV0374096.1 glutaminyl-peptide cyclotransferase [Microbacterium sp.]MCV0391306.1 glutaminyl-peptide cyclotransferase [Microbacterium sp.]MCV0418702.1 glutaminyl-peptide cyclotransferase [Microbacterium sp.]MCV0423147.1 glutaminyl-peptide cyclotransferase [Microbacterium sp.]
MEVTFDNAPLIEYAVRKAYAHDPKVFTQGLCFAGDTLVESRGGYGESSVRTYDSRPPSLRAECFNDEDVWGEGVCSAGGDLVWQLIYEQRRALLFNVRTMTLVREIPYDRDGWGLCDHGSLAYSTDGSEVIVIRDRETLDAVGEIVVPGATQGLNDLTYLNGHLWINALQSWKIYCVDISNGKIVGLLDCKPMFADSEPDVDLMRTYGANGITVDPEHEGALLVTGKYWPWMYSVIPDLSSVREQQ